MRPPRRPASHAPRQTALLPSAPSVVNPPKVRLTADPKQASAGDQSAPPTSPPRLLDALRHAIRVRHYSIRTEEAYGDWTRRFIRFHGRRHPRELGAPEVAAFLTHLAVDRTVAPSTQNQARSALMFLYRDVLQLELPWLQEVVAAKTQRRLPVVLTPSEVRALLGELSGTMGLVAALLYGTGMRLLEALRLRVNGDRQLS